MRAYSMDLRQKIVSAYESGHGTFDELADTFEIARRRLVFADETGFHLAMTRHFGRAPRGERVRQRVPRRRGTNVTLIGALALRGWVAALSFSGAVDREG